MKVPALPSTQSSASEILRFARSLIGHCFVTIEEEYLMSEDFKAPSRQCKLHFDIASITCITNIFNICDICLIEFNNLKDSSVCYELCNSLFNNIAPHSWLDEGALIQFYTNYMGVKSFRLCLEPLSKEMAVPM